MSEEWNTWRPGVIWRKGDLVEKEGKKFICVQDHMANEKFDKMRFDKWYEEIELEDGNKTFKYLFITSMDYHYYDKCGKVMLQSWKRHASGIGPMYVYNESLFEPKVKGVRKAGWNLGPEYLKFHKRHTNSKTKTFAKKGFPVIDAMNRLQCERLIWVDADAVFKQPMPAQFIELICPEDTLSTHFSVYHHVDGVEYHSCETGFFILNKNHPGFHDFASTYADIYHNDKTEGLRRFYDGEVYGKTVELMKAKGYKMLDLNPGRHKTPISRSIIHPYIQHYKAGLKEKIDFNSLAEEDDEV